MPHSSKKNNGVYYFIGNIPSHALHALPLHKAIGGTFVATSKRSQEVLKGYGVDTIMLDDKPTLNLEFGYGINKTIRFLNKNAKVVLFYELYKLPIGSRLSKPRSIFMTHGNMLKRYFNAQRFRALRQIDYMVGLGPYNKSKFINEYGIDSGKILDLGIARTDELHSVKGQVVGADNVIRKLNLQPGKPIITYMPTYWGASSVYNVGKDIIRNLPDKYNLIFRPHPQTPESIVHEYIGIINSKPGNAVYALEGRYKDISLTNMYEASSAIIGDISSVMLEAILLDKPLLFAYDSSYRQSAKDIESIQSVVNHSPRIDIESVRSLPLILDNTMARGIDEEIWSSTKDYTFFHHDGTSVESIVDTIESLL